MEAVKGGKAGSWRRKGDKGVPEILRGENYTETEGLVRKRQAIKRIKKRRNVMKWKTYEGHVKHKREYLKITLVRKKTQGTM